MTGGGGGLEPKYKYVPDSTVVEAGQQGAEPLA
jgi:hypothetical protein